MSITENLAKFASYIVANGKDRAGTNTNDSAAAGDVGEYVESNIPDSAPVSLVSSTSKNVTSISLTAGDWDVSGVVGYLTTGTTSVNAMYSSYSLISNTLDTTNGRVATEIFNPASVPGGSTYHNPLKTCRFSLAVTTTIYLIAYGVFTVSTLNAFGNISARRVRQMSLIGLTTQQATLTSQNLTGVTGTTLTIPGGYTAPYLMVSKNGSRLQPGIDFTAINGTTATLTSAAISTDVFTVDAFGLFDLANPSFSDAALRVVGSSDPTKKVAFEVDGLTTATTRTITVPDASGTMALTESGTFTGTLTGCTTSPTATFRYTKTGTAVIISTESALSGTSNSTSKTITGMPSGLYPSATVYIYCQAIDNGGSGTIAVGTISTSGVISLQKNANGDSFTASGSCTINMRAFCYNL